MSVEQLLKVVRKPAHPIASGAGDAWKSVERELKTSLPEDYKEYVHLLGLLKFNDFLLTFSPFAGNEHLNLISRLDALYESERVILLNQPGLDDLFQPFALHPAKPGLLPWGKTDNGDFLLWHTKGRPNDWPTLIYNLRGWEFEQIDMPMTEVLAGLLSGKLKCRLFPEDAFGKGVTVGQSPGMF